MYYNSWIEGNHLFIQMEYCSHSLRHILKLKEQVFGKQPVEAMNPVERFITCHIYREILECVQYLHDLTPRVIHRDLKPDNILIAHRVENNRFIKFFDFGLATVHDTETLQCEHSVVGSGRFIAPEVYQRKYNHKADIYSLAIIGIDMFGIDV